MAPAISHDLPPTLRALLNHLPTKRDTSRVLAKRSTQNIGYLAAIVVLSAIIIGYALYRLIKYYRARHGSEQGKSAPLASTTNRYRKGGGMLAEISVADSNYNSFPNTTASGHPNRRPHHHHQVSGTQYDEQGNAYVYGKGAYDPLSPPLTAGSSTGLKTPRLDWRPPTLTPWSRSGKSTSDGASDVDLEGRGGNGHHRGNDSISFPAQAYTEQGKPKEKAGGLFGFMSRKHNKGETYVLVNASPPIGSPPPQYARNGSMEGQDTPQTSATLPSPSPTLAPC
ncbi:hypothetical protein CPB86DRAFT_795360 [Serendipita vermifera]|nr:hypothetical protein CPB86DRAFT_795360 [Serendipita vermifera]